jgi:hypothetical protein
MQQRWAIWQTKRRRLMRLTRLAHKVTKIATNAPESY